MARLFNEPGSFAEEMLEGFAAAQEHRVRRVPGGVIRRDRGRSGEVAVVIGGGSGHYPAFSGLVGEGLPHGAAMGNLFASPSAQQVRSVATSAHHGGGVLLCYGNYAGDVLHFGLAEQRLRGDGIDCRTVVITDDVSSAPADERDKRRGVAGDLVVFKAASAAAAEGYDLDEVARFAEHANERTRSFGVAFSGCTLPGSSKPLFTVPDGKMAVGLGIHGEPGIGEQDMPTADELAELFVRTLLAEVPDGVEVAGSRVAVVLNGLGSVKYEELFVVYRRVALLLAEAGITAVEPEVGELVTSFDMAGASLTLCWLDEELERFWRAPADSAAYRKIPSVAVNDAAVAEDFVVVDAIAPATGESRESARCALAALDALKSTVDDNVAELGRIDAVAGDGDHGIGMQRGADAAVAAARDAVERGAGAGSTLNRAADAWADRAGGTSGALWGVALRAIGAEVGDETAPGPHTIGAAVRAASDAVVRLGKAELGDKTMVDALVPFADELEAALATGAGLRAAWDTAATAAAKAAEATASLRPLRGRARPLAEKSLGTPDAGAVSLSLITRSVHAVLAR